MTVWLHLCFHFHVLVSHQRKSRQIPSKYLEITLQFKYEFLKLPRIKFESSLKVHHLHLMLGPEAVVVAYHAASLRPVLVDHVGFHCHCH